MLGREDKMPLRGRDTIFAFILAGNAKFTLMSHKTGEHLTYRVRKSKDSRFENKYYVNAGRAQDCIGFLYMPHLKHEPEWKFEERKGMRANEKYLLPFKWFLHHPDSPQLAVYHEGTCGRCNRPLTDPESIKRGLGPECAQIVDSEKGLRPSKAEIKELF